MNLRVDPAPFTRQCEVVRSGFVTPFILSGFPPPPGKKATLSGCVYRDDGSKVAASERFGGHRGDWVISANPDHAEPPRGARVLEGRGLYLGHYMGPHYGHFITETLSSFWAFEDHPAAGFDYFLFHPFVFGERVPAHVKFTLECFGVDPGKIIFVGDEPLAVGELLVPERLLRLNHSVDPSVAWVYRRIAAQTEAPPSPTPRLYLSRRKLSRRNFTRVVANEAAVEAVLQAHGFQVIYPETMSMAEQVALYSRADVVAGVAGSALHNSVFMKPGATLIELGDYRYDGKPTPTQSLCDEVSGVRTAFVPFRGRIVGERGAMLYDMSALRNALADILGPPAFRIAPLSPRSRAEIGYLTLRAALNGGAKRLKRLLRRG